MAIIWDPPLDPEASSWRAIARQIAHDHLAPRAAAVDRDQRYPQDNVALLHDSGIATMFIPAQYGGAGASLTAFCAVIEELAQACASSAGIVATLQLGSWPLLRAGTDAQKQTYIGALARERKAISFALSEQGTGSDPSNMQTLAQPAQQGWRLRGVKRWVDAALPLSSWPPMPQALCSAHTRTRWVCVARSIAMSRSTPGCPLPR